MKTIYVTSVERYSGKTAFCLALGKRLIRDGYKVGYLKPLSLQPWRIGEHLADQDAAFVQEALHLDAKPWELCPVVITPEILRAHLAGQGENNLMERVKNAVAVAGEGKDILLLEGGGSLREGYSIGVPTPDVVEVLGSTALAITKFHDEVQLVDDALATRSRLGPAMAGVIINRVPEQEYDFVKNQAAPYIESHGAPVFGILPEVRELAAISVPEIQAALKAELLTVRAPLDRMVEVLTVGAMTAEAALSRFRRVRNKAVFTGGDRTDIQLAALETSTSCLILTGNLRPSPLILNQADEMGVPILLARQNTMEAIEAIERIFGKTNLGNKVKLQQFEALVDNYVDIPSLYKALDL